MRLRNNPKADNIIRESKYTIKEHFDNYFDNDNPLCLEVGMGKGDFVIGMAKKYPDINFIGVEKYGSVLVIALEKLKQENLNNVKILNCDAVELLDYFKKSSISEIYLNFSDPWPKNRHYKRRLSYKSFLDIYEKLLIDDGVLKQKTDNKSLFESSLISYNENKMIFEMVSVDLHNSEYALDNVMSEYERKFSSMNQPIYSAWVKYKKGGK